MSTACSSSKEALSGGCTIKTKRWGEDGNIKDELPCIPGSSWTKTAVPQKMSVPCRYILLQAKKINK